MLSLFLGSAVGASHSMPPTAGPAARKGANACPGGRVPALPRLAPAFARSQAGRLEVELHPELHLAVRVACVDNTKTGLANMISRVVELRSIEAVKRLEAELHA